MTLRDTSFGRATPRSRFWRHPWRAVLIALARRVSRGSIVVETPQGERLRFAGAEPGPAGEIAIRRWRTLRRLVTGGDVGFAEAYMDGDWSSPDPAALIELAACNEPALAASMRGLLVARLLNRLLHLRRRNTRSGSRRNIAQHYDLGNAFYARWLDPGMTYSSALFTTGDETLEQAQAAKYARVIDLLSLEGPAEILEIGCGWGGLAEALIDERGCRVTGLTLSAEQLAYARARLVDAGLDEKADLRLQDYRDVDGRFDRIVSIEMLEAVGEEHWPRYFATLRERLVPGGLAVLQVITIADERFEPYRRGADFIQRYVFPGGMLPSPSVMRREIARAGLLLDRHEVFGGSYARTLAEWRHRFQRAWPELAMQGFTPRFRQMWQYYLAYCEAGFRTGTIDVGLYCIVRPA